MKIYVKSLFTENFENDFLLKIENLADVSKPSHGVGMEILYAHQKGKKIIFLKKSGPRVSNMALFHAHETIEYEDHADLEKKLLSVRI